MDVKGRRIGSSRTPHPPRPADRGSSFIELLVAVVLLGTAVIAVLVALQTSTTASSRDADHARAFAWLHDASDAIFEGDRIPCSAYTGPGDPFDPANAAQNENPANWPSQIGNPGDSWAGGQMTVWGLYNDAVDAVPPPEGWADASIDLTAIEFLGQVDPNLPDFTWGATCYEGVQPDGPDADSDPDDYRFQPLVSQKVTIEVRSANGQIVKELETVKGDR